MEENTFHYIIDPDHEEYPPESVIGKNAAMVKKIEMYHNISSELLDKHTSTTHFTINLTVLFPHTATAVADDRQQTARKLIFTASFPTMREWLCRLWFESGWFKSIEDIVIRVVHGSGSLPPKHTVHEVRHSLFSNGSTNKKAVYARDAARVQQHTSE